MDADAALIDLPEVFVEFQQRLMASVSQYAVVVAEKSRRTGYSWSMAAVAVLTAAAETAAGGMDVYYMGYDKDMTREFVGYCGDWAKSLQMAAGELEESFFTDPENPEKEILTFRIKFASGFEISALSSAPRALRGKQGLVIIDEAAFHDNLDEVLKSALALLMWGGKVVVLSTHKGQENAFNTLVNDIRAGKKPYHVLRTTLDDAIKDGLVKRIFAKTGQVWSPEAEVAWRAEIVAQYGDDADEELFCVPAQGNGAFLSAAVIERCQRGGIPVVRLELPQSFLMMAEHLRTAEIRDFCERELLPLLQLLDPKCPHVFGDDFGRKRDLSVFWPLAIGRDLVLRTPFILEMRNVPHTAQAQIVHYIIDRLPLFRAGKFDAGGNGSYLAEVSLQKYGERIECVMLTEPWYRENMPRLKSQFDDGMIEIPRDREVMDDLRLLRLVRGVGRVPDERTGEKDKKRHGDAAVACVLAIAASRAEREVYEYEAVPRAGATSSTPGWHNTAAEQDAADDAASNGGGWMPELTRRIY